MITGDEVRKRCQENILSEVINDHVNFALQEINRGIEDRLNNHFTLYPFRKERLRLTDTEFTLVKNKLKELNHKFLLEDEQEFIIDFK